MARITKSERARIVAEQLAIADEAHGRLAPLVFAEGTSRVATLECLAAAYGPNPSREREEAVGLTYKAARMASTIPSNRTMEDRITDCRMLITKYASPDVASIRDDQMGKRDDAQEKAYRAAAQWLSKARADIGIGQAVTTKAKNAKQAAAVAKAKEVAKRAPHHNETGDKPDTSDTKPAVGKWTVERLGKHAEMQMASLLACLNATQKDTKGAVPPALSTAICDAKALIETALGVKQSA